MIFQVQDRSTLFQEDPKNKGTDSPWRVPDLEVAGLVERLQEIKEETGLDIYDLEFICFQEFIFDDTFWKKRHFIFFHYACKTDSPTVRLNSESQEYIWVCLEHALELPVEPYTKRTIEQYLKKRR